MDRQWLYPYYVIAILALVLFLFGCDGEGAEAFSVEVQVQNDEGSPVEGATVGLQPCYDIGQEVWCPDGSDNLGARAQVEEKPVELVSWDVAVDGRDVVHAWITASESNNDGFQVEGKRGGEEFENLGFVDGQGTTDESTRYKYRYEEDLPADEHVFRLVAVATDGTSRVVGQPVTVRIRHPREAAIQAIYPNPFRTRATYGVAVGDSSSLRSTLHSLDGARVRTIKDEGLPASGRYQYAFSAAELTAGVYEHRTQIRKSGEIVAGDTTHAAVAGTASLGATDADGTVSTTDRTRFPALYDVPKMEIRDSERRALDSMHVSPTVEFVVTTGGGSQTFRRTVSEGENTLTLTASP